MILDIGQIITQLGKEKGIDRNVIIGAIKDALESAAKKKYGMNKQLEATYDPETGDFEVLEFRTVVADVQDSELEITLRETIAILPLMILMLVTGVLPNWILPMINDTVTRLFGGV